MTDIHDAHTGTDGPGGTPWAVEFEAVERLYEHAAPARSECALAAMCAASPHDPWPLVWFAEALRRTDENAGAERCEHAAWNLALRALDERPSATEHLHVLARIYLGRGFPVAAVPLAAASALGSSADLALVTLAGALRTCGEFDGADTTAWEAVRRGSTVGHQVLAASALDGHEHETAVEHLAAVRRPDLIRYWGVDPMIEHVAADVPPLTLIVAPRPIGQVLAGVADIAPTLLRAASDELLAIAEHCFAAAAEAGLPLGVPDYYPDAFPNPFA